MTVFLADFGADAPGTEGTDVGKRKILWKSLENYKTVRSPLEAEVAGGPGT